MARKPLSYIKTVRSKGNVYEYFVTGKSVNGKPVLVRLPDRSDRTFGAVYAGMVAGRTARANVQSTKTMREVSRAYQLDDAFKDRATSTQDTYLIYLKVIEDKIGDAPVNKVERRDVVALLDTMSDRPGAANMTLLVLRNLFTLALFREWAENDPTKGVRELAKSKLEHEPWPMWLVEAGLADEGVRLAVALLFYTAQRIGDVCKMRWSDVRDGYLYVRQQKTGKELDIRIHDELASLLAAEPRKAMTIIYGPTLKPLDPASLRQRLQKFARRHGQSIVPHGLRKNAVNMLLEVGCTTAETSAISGQSLQLVEHYAKRRDSKKLGSAAILRWQGTDRGNRKPLENAS